MVNVGYFIRTNYQNPNEKELWDIYNTIREANTIRHILKAQGIKHDWRNIVRIMSTKTIQTVQLQTDKKTIHLRKPSKPIEQVQKIYNTTSSKETQTAIKKICSVPLIFENYAWH